MHLSDMALSDLTSTAIGGVEYWSYEALPSELLSIVLSHTTPRDVGRLAAVNKAFAEAARSDLAWRNFLPVDVDEIVQNAHGGPLVYQSLKGLYHRLADHVTLGDGTQGFWIDRKTGGVCRSYSARSLAIAWGDDASYWDWFHREGSRFEEVAYLKFVWWFQLWGEVRSRLPPGIYTVSWILQFNPVESRTWARPVKFAATDGIRYHKSEAEFPLTSSSRFVREANDNWWEYDVGKFSVEKRDDLHKGQLGEIGVKFDMKDIERDSSAKRGVYVDGVVIRPSSLQEPPHTGRKPSGIRRLMKFIRSL